MAPWIADLIERVFMPGRWQERSRLDPEIKTFEEKMGRFCERRASYPDPDSAHPREPIHESHDRAEKGCAPLVVVVGFLAFYASLVACYAHGYVYGLMVLRR